jgi:pimeloyl-ACP methyl ester carboxylesterase
MSAIDEVSMSREPLVLLHGLGGTGRVWLPVLPQLQAHHRVFDPTLPGHAGADPLPAGCAVSVASMVDALEAQLDEQGIDRAHIAGNSLGGWLALELARRGRARSVVAFAPGGAWSSAVRMAALLAAMRLGFRLTARLTGRADGIAARPRARRLLLASQVAHPERFDPAELRRSLACADAQPIVDPLLAALMRAPLEPLADPGCHVRVAWGEEDRVIPFAAYGAPLLDRVPGAELVMLPGVGHVPMSDDPALVASTILEVTAPVAQPVAS